MLVIELDEIYTESKLCKVDCATVLSVSVYVIPGTVQKAACSCQCPIECGNLRASSSAWNCVRAVWTCTGTVLQCAQI